MSSCVASSRARSLLSIGGCGLLLSERRAGFHWITFRRCARSTRVRDVSGKIPRPPNTDWTRGRQWMDRAAGQSNASAGLAEPGHGRRHARPPAGRRRLAATPRCRSETSSVREERQFPLSNRLGCKAESFGNIVCFEVGGGLQNLGGGHTVPGVDHPVESNVPSSSRRRAARGVGRACGKVRQVARQAGKALRLAPVRLDGRSHLGRHLLDFADDARDDPRPARSYDTTVVMAERSCCTRVQLIQDAPTPDSRTTAGEPCPVTRAWRRDPPTSMSSPGGGYRRLSRRTPMA